MSSYIYLLIILCIPSAGLAICRYLGIVEHPKWAAFYRRSPVPNIQGLWLMITFIALIARYDVSLLTQTYIYPLIVGSILFSIIGSIDVYRPIRSWVRAVIQSLIFARAIYTADLSITTINISWFNQIDIGPMLGFGGSLIWFLVCTNAINWFDGIESQASGVTALGSIGIWAVITFVVIQNYNLTGNLDLLARVDAARMIAVILAGVSLIYTYIEYRPQGLIRDAGTTLYGFCLAYLALLGGGKLGTIMVSLSLVFFDFVRVVINRIYIYKKNPLAGDYTHFHHRLLANGRSRKEVRWFVWIWSSVMLVLMILQGTDSMNKWIIFGMMAMLFFGLNIYIFWIKKMPMTYVVDFTPQEVV